MPTTVVTGSETDPDTSQYQRMDWETRRLGYKTGAATPLAAAAGALGAIITRPVAGPLFVLSSAWLHAFTIDDPVGAVPVHLVNGIWGTLAVSLFADGGFQLLNSPC